MRTRSISSLVHSFSVDGNRGRAYCPFIGSGEWTPADAEDRMKLYRTANDTHVNSDTTSFAEERDAAEAYLDNPNFGGARLYEIDVEIDDATVLDITRREPRWLREMIENRGGGCRGAAIASSSRIADAIAERGYKWVRLVDSYPEGAITMMLLGSDYAVEDALDAAAAARA